MKYKAEYGLGVGGEDNFPLGAEHLFEFHVKVTGI